MSKIGIFQVYSFRHPACPCLVLGWWGRGSGRGLRIGAHGGCLGLGAWEAVKGRGLVGQSHRDQLSSKSISTKSPSYWDQYWDGEGPWGRRGTVVGGGGGEQGWWREGCTSLGTPRFSSSTVKSVFCRKAPGPAKVCNSHKFLFFTFYFYYYLLLFITYMCSILHKDEG